MEAWGRREGSAENGGPHGSPGAPGTPAEVSFSFLEPWLSQALTCLPHHPALPLQLASCPTSATPQIPPFSLWKGEERVQRRTRAHWAQALRRERQRWRPERGDRDRQREAWKGWYRTKSRDKRRQGSKDMQGQKPSGRETKITHTVLQDGRARVRRPRLRNLLERKEKWPQGRGGLER